MDRVSILGCFWFLYVQRISAQSTVYTTILSELGSSGVTGSVTVFAAPSGLLGVGAAKGLEALLSDEPDRNCTANNGCGIHVHNGTSCSDTVTQGGHYYFGASDPWALIKYGSTDAEGVTNFSFHMINDAISIEGKPFIIHNNAGGRVACGLLSEVTSGLTGASLAPLSGSSVSGYITLYSTDKMVVGAGFASGLEADLSYFRDCTAKNGCGVHVHNGTNCTDSGGHYFRGASDPWVDIGYSSTSSDGVGHFVFEVTDEATNVAGKAFIVHSKAGTRVSCGLLAEIPASAPEALTTARPASNAIADTTTTTTATTTTNTSNAIATTMASTTTRTTTVTTLMTTVTTTTSTYVTTAEAVNSLYNFSNHTNMTNATNATKAHWLTREDLEHFLGDPDALHAMCLVLGISSVLLGAKFPKLLAGIASVGFGLWTGLIIQDRQDHGEPLLGSFMYPEGWWIPLVGALLAAASAGLFVKVAWRMALATLSAGLIMLLTAAICRLANTSPERLYKVGASLLSQYRLVGVIVFFVTLFVAALLVRRFYKVMLSLCSALLGTLLLLSGMSYFAQKAGAEAPFSLLDDLARIFSEVRGGRCRLWEDPPKGREEELPSKAGCDCEDDCQAEIISWIVSAFMVLLGRWAWSRFAPSEEADKEDREPLKHNTDDMETPNRPNPRLLGKTSI